jgi:uncharacterized membrane protein YccC
MLKERLIHSLKTVIACVAAFLILKIFHLPSAQWMVITVIIVMCAQLYVGSVLHKSFVRFIGTTLGCLIAALMIVVMGNTLLSAIIAIAISSFIFSFIATAEESFSYMGTLGAATTAIVLLSPNPTILIAGERFLEISLGILIATLVSQFILPIHARTHLQRTQANTLTQLRDYYALLMDIDKKNTDIDVHELDENIAKTLIKQRQLAKESRPERLGPDFDTANFKLQLYCEREILRATSFMHEALTHLPISDTVFISSSTTQHFNKTLIQFFNDLIFAIESETVYKKALHLPQFQTLQQELQKEIGTSSQESMFYVDGFLFSTEILVNSLTKLAVLNNLIIHSDMGS